MKKNISLPDALEPEAQRRIKETFTGNLSNYVQYLIRKDVLENPPPPKAPPVKK